MEFRLLRDVAERELGRPLERAYARFDHKALASASIGQVHRATLPNGEDVVVKIQYPGVADAIRADLANASLLTSMASMLYPNLDPGPVIAELRSRLLEELDYRREARNQQLFAAIYDGHPFIHVPRVISDHSTGLVLTSEYVAGMRFTDILASDEATRQRVAEILYRFVFGSIFRFGVFNGDPHPGNYIYQRESGRMTFVDFGSMKLFPTTMLRHWEGLMKSHLENNHEAFRAEMIALGFIPADSKIETDRLYDWLGTFYEPFHDDREFHFTREFNARVLSVVFKPEGRLAGLEKQLRMPPDFVLVNRIQWGLYSLLGQLGAKANFHRIHRELLYGDPPSTELGREADAHWAKLRATHHHEGDDWLLGEGGGLSIDRLLPPPAVAAGNSG
jgi:predicted unusual protein kinase regulating ubiquinone biosynthesis (AarF/ABC1/UbiB family)